MLILFLPQLFYSMHIFVNKPAYLLEDYITAIGLAGGIGLFKRGCFCLFQGEVAEWRSG